MTAPCPTSHSKTASVWLVASALGVAATIAPVGFRGPTFLLWNASASVPIGLYVVLPGAPLHTGDLAVSELPSNVRRLAGERRYLPAGVMLIKPVAAVQGARVCQIAGGLFVNDRWMADAKPTDLHHRPLPIWRGCVDLGREQILLVNPRVPDSFDGRYFGPTERNLVQGRAWPLLTFGGMKTS